jgi:hypothetical protein
MTMTRKLIIDNGLQDWKTESQDKVICDKGFNGDSNILPRSILAVGRQESSPQSLTAYVLNRYVTFKKILHPLRVIVKHN